MFGNIRIFSILFFFFSIEKIDRMKLCCSPAIMLCNINVSIKNNLPAFMNPLAIACAIFPPPMKPILCILKFTTCANGVVLYSKYGLNKSYCLNIYI